MSKRRYSLSDVTYYLITVLENLGIQVDGAYTEWEETEFLAYVARIVQARGNKVALGDD